MRAGVDKKEAIIESMRVNLKPVFITSATTAVGFLSMHFSDSPPFRELGYMLAAGNLIAFVNAALVLPALLAILPAKVQPKKTFFSCSFVQVYVQQSNLPWSILFNSTTIL